IKHYRPKFTDYLNWYAIELKKFLEDYEDNTELFFIKQEKSRLNINRKLIIKQLTIFDEAEQNSYRILNMLRNSLSTNDKIEQFLVKREIEIINKSNEVLEPNIAKDLKNPYPDIFKDDGFEVFSKLIKLPFDENRPDQKISFIFQKLKQEDKLRNTKFLDLVGWGVNNKFIDNSHEKIKELLINGYFHSPSKIFSKSRLALYDSIIVA